MECTQSCLTLCNPLDYRLPGYSDHGIFQTRTLKWVAISYSRGSSQPRDRNHIPCISCIAGGFFTIVPPGKPGWLFLNPTKYFPLLRHLLFLRSSLTVQVIFLLLLSFRYCVLFSRPISKGQYIA